MRKNQPIKKCVTIHTCLINCLPQISELSSLQNDWPATAKFLTSNSLIFIP